MKHSETSGADYSGKGKKVAIVAARFNGDVVESMRKVAHDTLLKNGVSETDIFNVHVPGAFELPLACKTLALQGFDAVIALGCVIRGDTPHFDYVCSGAALGIQNASLETSKPIAFGVLTTDTNEQALARSSTSNIENNKGYDAALCVLEMMNTIESVQK